jgi:hypothetical protein
VEDMDKVSKSYFRDQELKNKEGELQNMIALLGYAPNEVIDLKTPYERVARMQSDSMTAED